MQCAQLHTQTPSPPETVMDWTLVSKTMAAKEYFTKQSSYMSSVCSIYPEQLILQAQKSIT